MSLSSDFHTGVSRTGSGRDFSIEVVLDHDDLLAAIRIRLQDSLNRRIGSLAFPARNMPSMKHNEQV